MIWENLHDRPTTMLWAGVGEEVLGVIRLMYAEKPGFRDLSVIIVI